MEGSKEFSQSRISEYISRWGNPVSSENVKVTSERSIKVHCFMTTPPGSVNNGLPFYILITDGLSDTKIVKDATRMELIWYVKVPQKKHYEWISFISTVYLIDKINLFWRILPVVSPPSNQEPLTSESELTSVTFINPIFSRDLKSFMIDGDEVYTIWMLPITETERIYLQNRNADFGNVLADLLTENDHPYILDPHRKSYI